MRSAMVVWAWCGMSLQAMVGASAAVRPETPQAQAAVQPQAQAPVSQASLGSSAGAASGAVGVSRATGARGTSGADGVDGTDAASRPRHVGQAASPSAKYGRGRQPRGEDLLALAWARCGQDAQKAREALSVTRKQDLAACLAPRESEGVRHAQLGAEASQASDTSSVSVQWRVTSTPTMEQKIACMESISLRVSASMETVQARHQTCVAAATEQALAKRQGSRALRP